MSFPRYPKYKDSGVEWLGEVPQHWEVKRFQRSVYVAEGQVDPEDSAYSAMSLIAPNHIESGTGRLLSLESASEQGAESGKYFCKVGDVVYSKIRPSLRKVCIAPTDALCSADMYPLRAHSGMTNPFLLWSMLSEHFSAFAVLESQRVAMPKINRESLKAVMLVVPPLVEQCQIAEFLDRETGKIDELVAEQRRLMELLKEKRQAVISHAVTRGLNPSAPLKPSGIEWLGDVPAHWAVLPLKRIVSIPITDGPHETPHFLQEGVPFVSAEAVSSGRVDFSRVRACISQEDNARYSQKYSPKLHDIYMVKSGATTGVTAIVEDRVDFNIWSPLAAIRCGQASVPHFVLNFMRSRHFLEAVSLYWSFGTQQNIGMGVIENLACPVPPVQEQHLIVRLLKAEVAKLEKLTAEAQLAIDLLQERRTALISAAVTGQIDLRS